MQLDYHLSGVLRLLNPRLSDVGGFSVQVSVPAGKPFSVQVSEDLVGWRSIKTTSSPHCAYSFQDPEAPTTSKRFYRVVLEAVPPQ